MSCASILHLGAGASGTGWDQGLGMSRGQPDMLFTAVRAVTAHVTKIVDSQLCFVTAVFDITVHVTKIQVQYLTVRYGFHCSGCSYCARHTNPYCACHNKSLKSGSMLGGQIWFLLLCLFLLRSSETSILCLSQTSMFET